jgi:glucose/arabinose dehydrogenase
MSARFFRAPLVLLGLWAPAIVLAQGGGDAARGKSYFLQSCAICHADTLGPGNTWILKQGPSLMGVVGRKAASVPGFSYTAALKQSGLTWDAATLNHFLTDPRAAVPGTMMPIAIPGAPERTDLIAYLGTLKLPPNFSPPAQPAPAPASSAAGDPGDWRHAAPGLAHHITVADLPPPYATASVGNGPQVVRQPAGALPAVPAGFTVKLFLSGLENPRTIRIAPNGDIFVAETGANRIRVLRGAAGADAPAENHVFAEGLDGPFGIAFYPPGPDPHWVYVANNNSVVRLAYHNGDARAEGAPATIVPILCYSNGGHSTRDVAFSLDGKRMFISVGSGSNVAQGMSRKTPGEVRQWDAQHGRGAAWDGETNRADILVTDPEGKTPLHTFATGIRNGVGIAVNPETGDLWTSTNERDGLGDNLVPDYVSRVKEGGFYGWPWYYMGGIADPRHARERPDLAGVAMVPDVLLQSHSAPLGMCFYTGTGGVSAFPTEYRGDAFVACHGSWNRTHRTGYKVIRVRLKRGTPTGEYDDFLTGFVVDESSVWGRPVGVAVEHDGALLVSEDGNGTIWRVSYKQP